MYKIYLIFLSVLLTSSFAVNAQNSPLLSVADSLYQAGKYDASLAKYEVLEAGGQASSRMLLRMAWINEGLGHPEEALYYLNREYNISHNAKTLLKMEAVSEEQALSGYAFTDNTWVVNWFGQYRYTILGVLLTLCALLLAYLAFQLKRKKRRSVLGIAIAAPLLIACMLIVLLQPAQKAIIMQDTAWIMSDASSGSDKIAEIEAGNRLRVLDENDVWLQVTLEDRLTGWVKKSRVAVLR